MTLFIVVSGLLLVAVVAAVLYPLLRGSVASGGSAAKARELNLAVLREQRAELERDRAAGAIAGAAYDKAREELERRALEDVAEAAAPAAREAARRRPVVAGVVGLLVPAVVVPLYLYLGEPAAMGGAKPAAMAQNGGHSVDARQIAAMVDQLAAKLQDNPNDGDGWLMLARSYGAMGRFPESAAAYGRAVTLLPPDAQTLADFADTVAMAQGRTLQGEPEKIVRRALEVDPNNIKALALSGTIAFDRQNYQAAIGQWRKILALVPPDSGVATGIQGSIRDAENRMAVAMKTSATAAPAAAPAARGDSPAAPAAAVRGTVTLDPSLARSVAPGDTVFVFARAVDGPRIPLAMMKRTAADLPLQFSLDDSMAMAPNFRLSQARRVVVGARISKSGDAMPRTGDLEGLSAPVSPGAAGVKITINTKVK
ncbi:MAG TPA: c-type cytochrome biogenesis protein CcmI [Rhodocyclaceae bacterium]|nr:c-type cytochrome biogenesis protein CcmI [Rhodocyclaceae bacterium]